MLTTILSIVFSLLSILLVFVIVIQPSQGEGLASAFGGGGTESFFGTKAGQHINRFTIILSVVFLLLAVWLNHLSKLQPATSSKSVVTGALQPESAIPPEQRQQPQAQPVPSNEQQVPQQNPQQQKK